MFYLLTQKQHNDTEQGRSLRVNYTDYTIV